MPSVTEIRTFAYDPAWPAVGFPDKRPVVLLKLPQAGLFTIENVRLWPSGSLAMGVKL